MREVVIVSVARTPIGNLSGALSSLSATQLGSIAIKAAVERSGAAASEVDAVIMGNVVSANVGQAPARQAALGAGLGASACCTTINKVCASGMKAVMLAAQSIMLGEHDVIVAGGMESMTNAPHYLPGMRGGIKYGGGTVVDALMRDGLQDPYDQSMMGNCGEVCASEMNIGRAAQDAFSVESYAKARAAWANGWFDNEIVPVEIAGRGGSTFVKRDEEVDNARISDMASFEKMRPAFDKNGTITAANASKINDGAAAMVLMSTGKAKALGLKPIAKIISFADAEQTPVWFTTSPALAMPKALDRAGWTAADVDAFEINEAFAVVALANIEKMNLDAAKVNQFGGAVAMGHPVGTSGCRIIITLISVLQHKGGTRGLAGICNGGGGASAIAVELC